MTKSFEFSGNPHSEINKARWAYHMARHFVIPAANAGKISKSEAMRTMNKSRAALKTLIYGKRQKHVADLSTRVAGIPCGVVVQDFEKHHDGYEINFILVDRKGYRAGWLEDKMTEDDRDRINLAIIGGDL